jgi:thioredoxin 1
MSKVTYFIPNESKENTNFSVLKSSEDMELSLANNETVIVDVFANWCGPCKMIAPQFQALSKEFPSYSFSKINLNDLSEEYMGKVTALPTFLFFKKGELVERVIGADIDEVRAMINSL